jgi:hypothetical protein
MQEKRPSFGATNNEPMFHHYFYFAIRFSVLVGVVGLGGKLAATTIVPPEFSELVNQSDFIVRAVVKSVDSHVEENARGHKIYTQVELEIREVIAGRPPRPLVLRILGGKVGGEEMVLEGAPEFNIGDEDILFVQGNGQQIFPLVAISHGRYPIQREGGTGREFVARANKVPLRNTAEVARPLGEGAQAQRQLQGMASTPALTPADFVRQIKAAVKATNSRLLER